MVKEMEPRGRTRVDAMYIRAALPYITLVNRPNSCVVVRACMVRACMVCVRVWCVYVVCMRVVQACGVMCATRVVCAGAAQ
jgi:hypothetical protein